MVSFLKTVQTNDRKTAHYPERDLPSNLSLQVFSSLSFSLFFFSASFHRRGATFQFPPKRARGPAMAVNGGEESLSERVDRLARINYPPRRYCTKKFMDAESDVQYPCDYSPRPHLLCYSPPLFSSAVRLPCIFFPGHEPVRHLITMETTTLRIIATVCARLSRRCTLVQMETCPRGVLDFRKVRHSSVCCVFCGGKKNADSSVAILLIGRGPFRRGTMASEEAKPRHVPRSENGW